eukprot:765834-Lingulodinium_polyedra.AAC.1
MFYWRQTNSARDWAAAILYRRQQPINGATVLNNMNGNDVYMAPIRNRRYARDCAATHIYWRERTNRINVVLVPTETNGGP